MFTKERVQSGKVEPVVRKKMLFVLTFRNKGRHACSKVFWGFSFDEAVVEARSWANALPEYMAFDYDYVGH